MKETLGGALVMLCGSTTPSLELMQVWVLRNGNVIIVSKNMGGTTGIKMHVRKLKIVDISTCPNVLAYMAFLFFRGCESTPMPNHNMVLITKTTCNSNPNLVI
jgi:hypothetical protein